MLHQVKTDVWYAMCGIYATHGASILMQTALLSAEPSSLFNSHFSLPLFCVGGQHCPLNRGL